MDTRSPRVVIMGAGRMGRHHIAAASRGSRLEPVGFLEPDRDQRNRIEQQFRLPGFASPIDLLDACAPDCAIVAAPDSKHASLANLCRLRGIPALVEKPLCPDPASAHLLAAEFEQSGVLLAVGAIERFNPAWHVFSREILLREDLRHIRILRQGPSPRDPGSGVAFDLAIHDLDLLCRWLNFRQRPVLEQTVAQRDRVAATLRIGRLTIDLVAAWGASKPERTWSAVCGLGTGLVDLTAREATWVDNHGLTTRLPVPPSDPLELEHAALAEAVRTSATHDFPDLAAHLRALDLCQLLSDHCRRGSVLSSSR